MCDSTPPLMKLASIDSIHIYSLKKLYNHLDLETTIVKQ